MASLYIYAQIRFISREIYVGDMTNIGMGFDFPKCGYKNICKKYERSDTEKIYARVQEYSDIVWVKI